MRPSISSCGTPSKTCSPQTETELCTFTLAECQSSLATGYSLISSLLGFRPFPAITFASAELDFQNIVCRKVIIFSPGAGNLDGRLPPTGNFRISKSRWLWDCNHPPSYVALHTTLESNAVSVCRNPSGKWSVHPDRSLKMNFRRNGKEKKSNCL